MDAFVASFPADSDPTVLEYVYGMASDPSVSLEDVIDACEPMLVDLGVSEEVSKASLEAAWRKTHSSGTVEAAGPVKLEKSVLIANEAGRGDADLQRLARMCLTSFIPARVNALISVWEDGATGSLDADGFAAQKKLEKKAEKVEKKTIGREKVQAGARDELLRSLTHAPVVLHNSEALGLAGPSDIHLDEVSIDLGGMVLLDRASVTLVYGRKYGLVGRNGVGKTTFMKFLSSHAFEGMPNVQILHIEQEVSGTDVPVLQSLLNCDVEREALLAEVKEIEALGPDEAAAKAGRLADVYARLEDIDAATAPTRAGTILSGLGFTPEMQARPTKEFSGGWRMRVSLAMALFICPDVLLLDEPTNHLDLHAVIWLEAYLQGWKKMLLVVSHARDFLDAVCTDIIHFLDQKLTRWKGDYTTFEERRAEALRTQAKQHAAQTKEIAHVQAFIDKFRANAKRASMVQSRIKALERMATVEAVGKDATISFCFPNPGEFQGPIVQLIDVSFGYGDKPAPSEYLFTGANMSIDIQTRICLVGPNGAGKSTVAKLLFEDIKPTEGLVRRNPKARMARFSQHHVDQLDLNKSAVEFFRSEFPNEPVQKIRAHLGSMGVTGNMALQPIYTLSGGQKSRVSFAHITFSSPHFLLLDEPTNHLDLDTVQALIEALSMYEGSVLVISHDQHLIEAVCDQLWILDDKSLTMWKDDFASYKQSLRKKLGL
jgi:ATP-binding cassette subfamily F protein 3